MRMNGVRVWQGGLQLDFVRIDLMHGPGIKAWGLAAAASPCCACSSTGPCIPPLVPASCRPPGGAVGGKSVQRGHPPLAAPRL